MAWIIGLIVLAGIGGLLMWRRKAQAEPEPAFERPSLLPARSNAEPPEARPAPPVLPGAPLHMTLESVRMSASLVNATLAYRLLLTARADLGPLEISLQMASAHASRPAEEQFGTDEVPNNHRLAGMAAGEVIVLEGEVRLPLSAITPIRHGTAAMFVPLVRIDAAAVIGGETARFRRAFVVGLDEGAPGARLQPFRLDLGPRVYSQVGQRELTVPAFS